MTDKDVGLRIRVDRALREAFVEACQVEGRPASQVLRDFMRRYVKSHPPTSTRSSGGAFGTNYSDRRDTRGESQAAASPALKKARTKESS
ncbi:MAG: hypothetical protein EOR19_24015 [Mesorhizobium sp.]|nr:MAG: hypothetical protein EOR19_24015 [Mesorhizobium sp.]